MGRYVNSNEAIRRVFHFPIYERHSTVHLEYGQRVYFTTQNVLQRTIQPPSTTLTIFFNVSEG